ncbi:MAG: SPASM domain-containing protein [Elainellaceae cyanobacterium]
MSLMTNIPEFQHLSEREKISFERYQKVVQSWQSSHYMDYPQQVHIETQTVCNAKCVFCPYVELDRVGQRMSDELFTKIVNDLTAIPTSVPFTVCPFKISDPILEKRLPEMIDILQGKLPSVTIHLATNGSAFTESKIDALATTRRSVNINVSLNDHRSETYEKLMSLKFERTISNLELLHDKFVRGEFPHHVAIGRVSGNREEDIEFLEWVSKKFPHFRVIIKPAGNWIGNVSSRTHDAVLPIGCLAWFQVSIMATGDVALCCMDAYGEKLLGNVSTSSVLEIYNSPEHRQYRESQSRTNLSPCSKCTYPETSSDERVPMP